LRAPSGNGEKGKESGTQAEREGAAEKGEEKAGNRDCPFLSGGFQAFTIKRRWIAKTGRKSWSPYTAYLRGT